VSTQKKKKRVDTMKNKVLVKNQQTLEVPKTKMKKPEIEKQTLPTAIIKTQQSYLPDPKYKPTMSTS
jgi:diaminopimelate epimerase